MKKISVIALVALAFCATSAIADDTLWARTYAGPGANMDQGRAVACIGTDIYVAGQEMITEPNILVLKYRANGDTAWARTFNIDTMEQSVDIAVGSDSGPVILVSLMGPNPAYRLVKLEKDGDTAWTRKRTGVTAANLAMDNSGNIFVLGSVFGAMPNESLGLAKYTAAGALEWQKAYDFGDNHRAGGAVCDAAGNILGTVSYIAGGMKSAVVKFSPSGDTLMTISPAALTGAEIQAVAGDPAGFILIGATRGAEYLVARCSTGGQTSWVQPVPGLGGSPDAYNTLTADADTNVVIGGVQGQFCAVAKLTQQGQPYWSGNSNIMGQVSAVAVDAEKRPIVVGMVQSTPPSCLTIKFAGAPGISENGRINVGSQAGATLLKPGAAIAVNIAKAGHYSVLLVDAQGSLVRQLYSGNLSAGTRRFNPGVLASGSYYVKVLGQSGADTKLIQIR